jgi:hypothetical protein
MGFFCFKYCFSYAAGRQMISPPTSTAQFFDLRLINDAVSRSVPSISAEQFLDAARWMGQACGKKY